MHPSAFPSSRVAPAAALLCTLLASAAAGSPLKGQLRIHPEADSHRLLVKFRASAAPALDADGRLSLADLPLAKSAALPDLRYVRALDGLAAPRPRRAAGGRVDDAPDGSDGRILAEFAGLLYVDAPGVGDDSLLRLGRALEALDAVEYAALEPRRGPPPPGAVDIPPVTSSYTAQQGWLGPSSSNGLDCRYAWTRGAMGRGVRLHDIEDSWGDLDHEDFDADSLAYGRPRFSDTYADHGVAVFGATFAQHNAYGVDGCAPQATGRAYSFQNASGQQSRASTLVLMGEMARPGDVILLEMQAGGLGGDNLAPADVDAPVWDATKAATDKGVVVIGTAGNGSANLDGSAYAAYRARGDNGVIMTGGGNSSTRARYVGSYGACCVHVQGWGHNVTTTGYGGLFNPSGDIRQRYTATFSGTSSAGAVVAAAAVALQSHALAALGRPLAPREMRAILVATGRPHTGASHIGPLPDLRAAILRVDSLAALAADTTPPSALSYPGADTSTALVLRVDSALAPWTPSVTGKVTAWSIQPPLPAGLSLDTLTGVLSGTPAQAVPATTYTVTATGPGGAVATQVRLAVEAATGLRADARLLRGDGRAWEFAAAPGAERVTVAIFDLRGRPVWEHAVVPGVAGVAVRLLWDGRDARGALVPPGQYVARITEIRDGRPRVSVRRSVRLSPH